MTLQIDCAIDILVIVVVGVVLLLSDHSYLIRYYIEYVLIDMSSISIQVNSRERLSDKW